MKKCYRIFVAAFFALMQITPVFAASTIGYASATIIDSTLTVSMEKRLDFGVINSASKNGEIVITTAGERLVDEGINVLKTHTSYHSAKFHISGNANSSYNIILPTEISFTTDSGEGSKVIVNNFKSYSKNVGENTNVGKLDKSGEDELFVGGRLIVPTDITAGRYRGEVPVTVHYYY